MSVITDQAEIKRIREFANNPDNQGYCQVWHEGLKNIIDTIEAHMKAFEDIRAELKDLDLEFVDEEYRAGVAYGIMKFNQIINKHDPSKARNDKHANGGPCP